MIIRSKAPLRIGLAGGGTDVSPYSDMYGGAILNATISLYAYCNIEINESSEIVIEAKDMGIYEVHETSKSLPIGNGHNLVKGVYNKIQELYPFDVKGLKITTFVDAPPGSGLGTSSTLVVTIVGAFVEMLKLPLGDYEIASLAFDVERKDLDLAGGKQDQYAATFGGVNFMEFYNDERVIVNPLRINNNYLRELENNLVLFFTATSRESAKIILEQKDNVNNKKEDSIEAMHQLKLQANQMKEALLKGQLDEIGDILDFGFEQKRKMAHNISNPLIETIYETAKSAGAKGGKISGAGGGGFMIFYCPKNSRYNVIEQLKQYNGVVTHYNFTKNGLITWTTL
jgi:D-glycero-alpha-D-manno-heptose-7-phosphate kinase